MATRIPVRRDIVFTQGATFRYTVTWKDGTGTLIDTAGYTGRLQVRANAEDAAPVFPEMNTANGGIVVGRVGTGTPTQYNVLLTLTATALDAVADWGKGVYDLELIDPLGSVFILQRGYAWMERNITR